MSKNFYFLCAKGTHGGPEAIHQIVDKINNLTDHTAYVAYFQKQFIKEEKFKSFKVNYINIKDVPDIENSVICATETNSYFLRKFKKANKVMVWLSLYYYIRELKHEKYTFLERCKYLYPLNRFPAPFFPLYYIRDLLQNRKHFKFDMPDVIHTQNCEYVAEFLRQNGVSNNRMIYLDGPVRSEYFENFEIKKENLIAYNPGKEADKYMPQIIEEIKAINPKIKFVAIKDLDVLGVRKALSKASLYLDFGFFPGPEKLVKEAALCGCNILTSDFGAAKNNLDIFIPSKYKFNVLEDNNKQIAKLSIDMINNYENYHADFIPYIEKVNNLYYGFEKTVIDFTKIFDEAR